MYLPNASSINHYTISEQKKNQRAAIGGGKFNKCFKVLVLIFRPLGVLLMSALCAVIVAFLTLIVGLYLIGHVIFGRRKLSSTRQKKAVPFCKQNSEGATSLLFTFLILGGMHISSSFLVSRKKETLSQSKGTPIQGEAGTVTVSLYE